MCVCVTEHLATACASCAKHCSPSCQVASLAINNGVPRLSFSLQLHDYTADCSFHVLQHNGTLNIRARFGRVNGCIQRTVVKRQAEDFNQL